MNPINKYFSKVFVINMEKDVGRMNDVSTMLNKESVSFERFEAVNGGELSKQEKDALVTTFCNIACTNSIIGCALSHHKIWEKIVDEDIKNALILEDDVFFAEDYKGVLEKAMAQLPEDCDILYLGCTGLCEKSKKYYNPFTWILHLFKNNNKQFESNNLFVPEFALSAHAYAITNAGCRKLLKYIEKVNQHIDIEIAFKQKNLNIYSCHPNIAYQKSDDSNITNLGFPKYINKYMYNFRDNKNFRYSYYLNVPIIQNINHWNIIFIILGILASRFKCVLYACIFLFIIDINVRDINYILIVFGFFTSYYIAHCKLYKLNL